MEQSELLRFVVSVLERLNLPYFVTGSTVTIFYGEPRFTNDIDIVVDLPAAAVEEFCRQFPEDDFYVSQQAASDAVRRRSQFNIIQPRSGLKVDVIVPAASEFNRARFAASQESPGRRRLGRLVLLSRGRHPEEDGVLPRRRFGQALARHHRCPQDQRR